LHLSVLRDVTERKRTVEALRANERRFKTLAGSAPVGIFETDAAGNCLFVNDRWCEMAGMTPDQARGDGWAEALDPDDRDRIFREWYATAGEGREFTGEYRFRTPQGRVTWLAGSAVALRDEAGSITGYIGTVTDVSGLKRAEAAVRESEGRLRAIIDNWPSFVFVKDREGRYLLANKACEAFAGEPAERVVGKTDHDYLPAEVADRFRADDRRVLETGEPLRYEEVAPIRGEPRHLLTVKFPLREAGGRSYAVCGIATDITELKRADEALRASRERLDLVVNSVDVGLWYCDLPFDKLVWNAKVKEHFGLPADADVTIDTFYERLHPDDRERTRQAIERSIREHTPYDIEYRTMGPDGRERWVRAIGRTFYGPTGRPAHFDGITVDVTERVRQEQALKDADRRKDEFLATLAHELRNPLAPLRNGLQVMKLAAGDAGAVEQARSMMERQLGQMVRLIDDLLDVSRITRGKLQLRRERVDLAAVVRAAVETARPVIEASAHELTVALPPEPVYLEADPVRLAQVFANLLTNAAKYTERAGRIRLTALRDGPEVAVAVRDTGIGIAPEKLAGLFQMFSQVDTALERSQGGLGIGLSLVRGLVEMHGGSVEARSEGLGRGSEFVVRLPVADGPGPSGLPPAGGGAAGESRPRRRILVADDNRDAADSLAMMLQLQGHGVHTSHDGQEAVVAAEEFRPDLILMDIGMPRLNGYEACRRIRGRPWGKDLVIVALTGWGQEEDRRRATEAGFDEHLTKPVAPATLEKLLAGLSDRRGK
jgi:PAS domain S-box-containing protein